MKKIYICYRSKLIELQTRQEKEIVGTIHKFDHCSFIFESEICFKSKENVTILTARPVREDLTGEIVPTLIIQTCESFKRQLLILAITPELTKFVPLRKVLDRELLSITERTCLTIIDGPVILSVSKYLKVYVPDKTNMCTLTEQSWPLPTLELNHSSCSESSKSAACSDNIDAVLESKMILHVSYEQNGYMIFLNQPLCYKCLPNKSVCLTRLLILKYSFSNEFKCMDSKNFVPEEYQTRVTCLQYFKVKQTCIDSNRNVNKVIVGTRDGFMLELDDGYLIRCISLSPDGLLPETAPIKWIQVPADSQYNDKNGFLVVVENTAIAIAADCKIIKNWYGISKVFSGSWKNDGSVQYLLFKGEDLTNGWSLIDSFSLESHSEGGRPEKNDTRPAGHSSLTSVLGSSLTSVSGSSSLTSVPGSSSLTSVPGSSSLTSVSGSSSLTSALEALQIRLQEEKQLLFEEEQECRRAERLLTVAATRQLKLQENLEPVQRKHSLDLLPLITGSSYGSSMTSKEPVPQEQGIEVVELWQRTYSDSWLIGVCFRNNTDSDLLVSVCLSPSSVLPDLVTCQTNQLLSRGKHCQCGSSQSSQRKVGGRKLVSDQKIEREPEIITVKTGLPYFGASNSYSVQVFIMWTKGKRASDDSSSGPYGGKVFSLTKREKSRAGDTTTDISIAVHSKYCGEMVLKSEDVILGRYQLDMFQDSDSHDIDMQDKKDAKQDLVALVTIQQTTLLEIRALPTILSSFETLLVDRCEFIYNHRLFSYVSKIQGLAHVQVQLDTYTGNDRRIVRVYTRSDQELCLLVHHLYTSLPDLVIILLGELVSSDAVQHCLQSLQNEIHFMSSGVRKLLDDYDPTDPDSLEACLETEEDTREIGEKFKRRQEKLKKKMDKVLSSEKIKELCEQITSLGKESDFSISKFVLKQ